MTTRPGGVMLKLVIGVAVASSLAYLFLRSVNDARSEPYVVPASHLRGWQLALDPVSQGNAPLLVLRPPQEFSGELFSQVFARMMESLKGSSVASVPIVLQGEFELALAGATTPESLLAAARDVGLESAEFTPRCLATRRVSEPGSTRQIYFVVLDSPEFVRFRQGLAAGSAAGLFDPAAISPVMIVGGTDANFNRWLPIVVNRDTDCVAPITVR